MAEQSGAVRIYQPGEGAGTIKKLFSANLEAMKRAVPRSAGDSDRLIRVAFNAIIYNTDLLNCTQKSLMGGVLEAVKLGLTLGGPAQEAWLLPFNDKENADGKKTATLVIGYQGFRNLIDRAKAVLDLHPRAVYVGDEFSVKFTEDGPKLTHVPYYMRGTVQGLLTHVYAVARLRGGGRQLEVLTRADVDKHRARSRAKNSGPWVTDYDAMALKTAIRVIAKYLPKSSDMALSRALDVDERADLGTDQDFDISGLTFDEPTKTVAPSRLEALKEQLRGEGSDAPALRVDTGQSQEDRDIDAQAAKEAE